MNQEVPENGLDNDIPYVYVVDEGYVEQVAASILTLKEGGFPGRIYLIHPLEAFKDRSILLGRLGVLPPRLDLQWIPVALPDEVSRLPPRRYVSGTAVLRFFIPELLHDCHRWVFYLDADTLVFGNPARAAREAIGSDGVLGMCRDAVYAHWNDVYAEGTPADPLSSGIYYNSGVALMQLPGLMEMGFRERCLSFLTEHGRELKYLDQDTINAVMKEAITQLPPKFNVQPPTLFATWLSYHQWRRSDTAVMHFTGEYKLGRGGLKRLAARWDCLRILGTWNAAMVLHSVIDAVWADGKRIWFRLRGWE